VSKTQNKSERDDRLRQYAMMHMAEVCREFADLQELILELSQYPERHKNPAERIAFWRECAEKELSYIEQIVRDLRDTSKQSEKKG